MILGRLLGYQLPRQLPVIFTNIGPIVPEEDALATTSLKNSASGLTAR